MITQDQIDAVNANTAQMRDELYAAARESTREAVEAAVNASVRTYPRTQAEAFKGADYASCIEPPHRRRFRLTGYEWGVLFSLGCLALGLYFGSAS